MFTVCVLDICNVSLRVFSYVSLAQLSHWFNAMLPTFFIQLHINPF